MLYNITTFGCQMNVHDSEKIAGMLQDMGYISTDNRDDADVIVFNTCAIREGAEDRAFGNIGALKKLKRNFPDKIIVICGCMTQQEKVAQKLFKLFPFVDIIIGTHNVHELPELIKQKIECKKRILGICESSDIIENVNPYRTSGENAWVNIMYGCNNFCSYCIVPYVRGREKSRNKENILKEVENLVKQKKYKTITLLGQNVNSYGNDNIKNGNFAQLLKDICEINGDFKVTFMTSHPKDLTDEVIETIAKENKILKEVHLPCQSGNNRILKLMNRKYTVEHYVNIVQKLREKIPAVRLTSDFIVGFPGETEEEFMDTYNLVKEIGFDGIFAFMYSKREGTVAEKMDNQIDDKIKNERVNRLLNLSKLKN